MEVSSTLQPSPVWHLEDLDPTLRYTYADYLAWKFTERVELLKGYLRQMSAPNVKHQRISMELSTLINLHFRKQRKPYRVFHAPFDVRLYNRQKSVLQDREVFTVVQPDLCVVCDAEKLADGKGCNGAPEWIIEILSPSSAVVDTKDKFSLYEEAGVNEYWIVYPGEQFIQQYVLREGKYHYEKGFTVQETATSALFPEFSFPMSEIFPSEN